MPTKNRNTPPEWPLDMVRFQDSAKSILIFPASLLKKEKSDGFSKLFILSVRSLGSDPNSKPPSQDSREQDSNRDVFGKDGSSFKTLKPPLMDRAAMFVIHFLVHLLREGGNNFAFD